MTVRAAAESPEVTKPHTNHWSLQMGERPAVPVGKFRNPIDAFVSARLAREKLKMSPPADRGVLIRRLNFDLLGLPPTPEEIDAFVRNRSPRAYEELVD